MSRLPNFDDLRQQRRASIEASKEAAKLSQVNTKRQRSSEPGNAGIQGPSGRSNRATRNKDYF
jgi:hypothetical protein